ncbi:LPD7 domain-containing protein [Type-D symbiont of Plautia stali]|uniref:LPD7 domain-containing protein n=1 Tax=Type-D symbiont of Plautia stali TaxID=1560356 RepID=UPI00073F8998|nr:LPD7 domain-containing protein [Type-D symbiont of Plautia stali]
MSTADYPVWLAVLPDQRDAARADAGKHPDGRSAIAWDKEAQLWYARPGADLSRLQKWLPDRSIRSSGGGNPQDEFLDALTSGGLVIDGLPVMDGRRHRVPVADGKKGNKDGVYRGFLDGIKPGGWFINYHRAENDKDITRWKASSSGTGEADPVARVHIRAVMRQSQDDFAREQAALYARQTAKAKALYDRLPAPDPAHAYLVRKGITVADDVRQTRNGALVVPFRDADGAFRTLQYIPPDGEKYLYKDAPKAGHFRVEGGELRNGEPVLYAEGYATARSLHMVTGRPVVMTIDAGNMETVASVLKDRYPDSPHLFMADVDHTKDVNKGVLSANRAAAATGGAVLLPDLTAAEIERGFTDFNDLHLFRGAGRLRETLLPDIAQALEQLNHKDAPMATPDDAQSAPDNLSAAFPDAAADTTPARRPGAAKEKTDEILKLRDEGLKPAQIAEQLGIGQTSVYRILKAQQPVAAPATSAPAAASDPAAADAPAVGVNDLPAAAMPEQVVAAPAVAEAPTVPEPQPAPAAPAAAPEAEADVVRAPPAIQGELRGALSALIQGSITPGEFQDTTGRLQRELNQVRESGTYTDAYVSETQAVFDRLTGGGLAVSERPGMFSRALSAAGLKDSDTTFSLRSRGYSDVRTIPAQIQSLYTRLADGELSRPQLEKALREARDDLRRAELSGQPSPADVQSSWAAFGRLDLAAGETEGRAVTAAVAALSATRASAAAPAEAAPVVADAAAPVVQPEKTASPDASSATPEPVAPVQNAPVSEAPTMTPDAAADVAAAPEPASAAPAMAEHPAAIAEPAPNVPDAQPSEAPPAAGAQQSASASTPSPDFSVDFADISQRLKALKDEAGALDTDVLAMRTGALINERIALTEMWSQVNDTESARGPSDESEALEAELRAELDKRSDAVPSQQTTAFSEENAILVGAPRVVPQDEDLPASSGANASRIDADKLLSRVTHEKHPDGKSVMYKLDGEPAFIDRGNRLVMAEGSSAHEEKVLAALLTAANHYQGRIELTGSDEFKAFAIGVIVANKLNVSMKNASQQADLDAARLAAGQPVTPAAPVDAVRGDPQPARVTETPPVTPAAQPAPASTAQQTAEPVTASPKPAPKEPATPRVSAEVHTPAEKAREPVTGKVTACGQAPFRFETDASESTFITLRTKEGSQTFWGKELAGLLRETHLQPGRMVTLQWMGEQPVTVNKPMKDAQGNFTGQYEKVQTRRNQWSLAPVGGTRVQTGAEDMVRLAAVDVNRYTQIQHVVVSRLGLDIHAPPKPADGLYWLKPDGQGSTVAGDPLSAPRPEHNERAGTAVMSAWGDDGRPDLYLAQGDGHYLQGVVRQEGVYQHVLVSLPDSKEAPPMVINLLTPEGAQPIGSGNGINRSNGQPVPREHVVVRLTGDEQQRIAKLDAPADLPAALHARLGYDERYKAESGWVKDQPAAAPQAAPATPPRPAQ